MPPFASSSPNTLQQRCVWCLRRSSWGFGGHCREDRNAQGRELKCLSGGASGVSFPNDSVTLLRLGTSLLSRKPSDGNLGIGMDNRSPGLRIPTSDPQPPRMPRHSLTWPEHHTNHQCMIVHVVFCQAHAGHRARFRMHSVYYSRNVSTNRPLGIVCNEVLTKRESRRPTSLPQLRV
jgi:hypothetical protein